MQYADCRRRQSKDACRAATVSSVSLIFRWRGPTNGERLDSRRRRGRDERSTLARWLSLQRPIDTALCCSPLARRSCSFARSFSAKHPGSGPPLSTRLRTRRTQNKQHLWKRKFSARDFRPDSTAKGRQTCKIAAVDRTRPLKPFIMSDDLGTAETAVARAETDGHRDLTPSGRANFASNSAAVWRSI